MKPAFNRLSRRQFLIGAGGTALALPLLPSLLPREAQAAAMASASAERYLVHTTTWHGVFPSDFYGPLLKQTPAQTQKYGGFEIRSAPLAGVVTTENGMTVISEIVRAKSSALNARILSRMNVINGLDFALPLGHNRGGSLGGDENNPTIDQVLATSKSFYPSTVIQPAIVRSPVSLSKSGTGTRTVLTQSTAESNVKLFDRLFKTSTSGTAASDQVVLVDRVKEHADLVMADRACSADCKARLGNYLDLLHDVQSKVMASATSSNFSRPVVDTEALEASTGFYGQPSSHAQCERLWNDIVVAAFAAGMSRVYVCGPSTYTFGPESEQGWHGIYAHGLDDPAKRAGFNAAVQLQFDSVMLDIANKLDQITTADGKTLFDKSLVASGFELGSGCRPDGHSNRCIPIITLGDIGGYLNTGLSLDYRDLGSFWYSSGFDPHWYSGLLYTQWMGMVLRGLGVSKSDYDTTVWGYPNVRSPNGERTDDVWNVAGQDLPWLRA